MSSWTASTTVRSSFAQAPGAQFSVTGAAFSRESVLTGAGISTNVSAATQVFLDYDAKVNGGYLGQTVSAGLRVDF